MDVIEALKEGHRYEDVQKILTDIINKKDDGTYPVNAFVKDNETLWRVDCTKVKEQAKKLQSIISQEKIFVLEEDEFVDLLQYVNTHVDILLHNYANAISHRREPYVDMEEVRSYSVLWITINNLHLMYYGEEPDFSIPKGWRCVTGGESDDNKRSN